ncbi:MAG: formate/nitrite transporter family protein [Erysipelotrichaceae bacterium]
MNKIGDLLKGILAGLSIGIGAAVFLSVDNKIVGAVLFSVGLYVICTQGLNLYTGKVGYLVTQKEKGRYLGYLMIVWLGNLIGTFLSSFLMSLTRMNITEKAMGLCSVKNSDSYVSLFVLAIFCGVLMYAAVDGYKKCNNPIILIFCVAVFILCGFEHSIADMAYYFIGGMFNLNALIRLIVITIGNGIGGVLIPLLKMEK